MVGEWGGPARLRPTDLTRGTRALGSLAWEASSSSTMRKRTCIPRRHGAVHERESEGTQVGQMARGEGEGMEGWTGRRVSRVRCTDRVEHILTRADARRAYHIDMPAAVGRRV